MIKTALIGLGRIGWKFHLPQIRAHEGFSLCAVVDTDAARRQEAFELCGANGYDDYREMLRREQPDLVVIASPTTFHEEQAVASLRAGADVLLDKPMTPDLESARRVEAAVAETGRKMIVYQPHRCVPLATVVRRMLDEGILGRVYMMKRSNCAFVHRNDWQAFKKYGGGMLNNYGSHFIDQLLYLSQSKASKLFCQLHRVASLGDAEDVVKIVIETQNGVTLDLDINQATAVEIPPLMIFGEYGTAVLARDAQGREVVRARYYDPSELKGLELSDSLAAQGRAYPHEQIPWKEKDYPLTAADEVDFYAKCYDYFSGNAASFIPLSDTMAVMQLLHDCREMAEIRA